MLLKKKQLENKQTKQQISKKITANMTTTEETRKIRAEKITMMNLAHIN